MPQLSYQEYPKKPVALDNLSAKFMKEARFVPLSMDERSLRIAMADTEDFYTIDSLRLAYGLDIVASEGKETDIHETIERLYGTGSQTIETIIEEADKDIYDISPEAEEDAEHLRDMASEAPIIRRVDGVLHDVESPPVRLQAAIISRIKIMANLDIAERRLPQDGRIKLKIADKKIDFRVSTVPTVFGESVVMRILDRDTLILDLAKLGFPDDIFSQYIDLVSQPYGMILVTGPTGSGKTSTLYTTLEKINSSEKKIITLEEPVEYQLRGINQIQVHPKIGLSFATGLRSIVRQDPDIILVGEIRDKETAEIAIQSALTGHLLFSTLHTNDAAGAISRLIEIGVEHFLLSSTLLGVLAQRLVRVICPNCKETIKPKEKLLRSIGVAPEDVVGIEFFSGKGCEECRHTGFRGRTGIFEYLPVDGGIRREITQKSSTERIKEVAVKGGMRTLRQDGWRKVKEGITTIPEVFRVTLEN